MQTLPPLATMGIGSLPFHTVTEGLEAAFALDVPTAPELPRRWPREGLLAAASSTTPLHAWKRFASRVKKTRAPLAKVQLVGPHTAQRYRPEQARVHESLLNKAIGLIEAIEATGARPLLVLDEPGLVHCAVKATWLEPFIAAAHRTSALVGLHCCGNADWPKLLGLKFDVLSFDATRCLDEVSSHAAACRRFTKRGGRLALGVVPTDGRRSSRAAAVALVQTAQRRILPRGSAASWHAQVMLSPACGLAGLSARAAHHVLQQVHAVQAALRATEATA